MTAQALRLVSNVLCPYTQRAAIQLAEKRIGFERVYIDLADRPAWFHAISPLGKVPVLQVGDAAVFESAVICEFIEDAFPAVPQHPAEPLRRARCRGAMEFASALIAGVFAFYMAPDEASFDRQRRELATRFAWVEHQLADRPWFDGAAFTLADAAFAPVFRLFDTFDAIDDFGIVSGLPRVAAYRQALAERPSVRAAVAPDYAAVFENYLEQRGSQLSRIMTLRRPS